MAKSGASTAKKGGRSVENAITAVCWVYSVATVMLGLSLGSSAPAFAAKTVQLPYQSQDGLYSTGLEDGYFVCWAVATLTVLRRLTQDFIFLPVATILQVGGNGNEKNSTKFKQQGWVLIYYAVAFIWGLKMIYGSEYWFNTTALWHNMPQNVNITLSFKLYFLFQTGFWFHMVFVTLIEPWQKDFVVMILHHVITIAMLLGSYWMGWLRIGHAILVEQDFADVFLPAAKMCNYVGLGGASYKATFQTLSDVLFATFAVVWIPTRHVILPLMYRSIFNEAYVETLAHCNCGQGTKCLWAPERSCFVTEDNLPTIIIGYKLFLGFFQILLAFWLKELLAAVYKAIVGGGVTKSNCEEDSAQNVPELDAKKEK